MNDDRIAMSTEQQRAAALAQQQPDELAQQRAAATARQQVGGGLGASGLEAQVAELETRRQEALRREEEIERREQELNERVNNLQRELDAARGQNALGNVGGALNAQQVQQQPGLPLAPAGGIDVRGHPEPQRIPAADAVNAQQQQQQVAVLPSAPRPRMPNLPRFFRNDPALWFGTVEGSFRTFGIHDERAMADVVSATLEEDVSSMVRDLIINPDPCAPYSRLKERLLSLYGESSEARLRRLLRGQVRTDGKPSQVLAQIRAHAGSSCHEAVLRSIFLEHMQENMRGLLVAADKPDLASLAAYADKLAEVMSSSSNVFAVSAPESEVNAVAKRSSPVASPDLAKAVRELLEYLKRSNVSGRSRSDSRGSSDRQRSRSKSRNKDPSGLCYLHAKFGVNAYNCRKPCTWQGPAPSDTPTGNE